MPTKKRAKRKVVKKASQEIKVIKTTEIATEVAAEVAAKTTTPVVTMKRPVKKPVETLVKPAECIKKMVTAKPVPKPVSKEKKFFKIPSIPKASEAKVAPNIEDRGDPLKNIVDKEQKEKDAKMKAEKELFKNKEAQAFKRRAFLAWKIANSQDGKELIDILKGFYSPMKYAKDSISMKNYLEIPENDRLFLLGKLRMLEEIENLADNYDRIHNKIKQETETKQEVK